MVHLNRSIKLVKMAGFGGFGIGFDHFSGGQLSHYTIVCQHFSVPMSLKETICIGN